MHVIIVASLCDIITLSELFPTSELEHEKVVPYYLLWKPKNLIFSGPPSLETATVECMKKMIDGENDIVESRVLGKWEDGIDGPSHGRGRGKKVANKLYKQFWRHNDEDHDGSWRRPFALNVVLAMWTWWQYIRKTWKYLIILNYTYLS